MGKINKSYLKDKFLSTKGYKRNSPDVNNPYNVIPSNQITMKGVDFPVMGIDNMGNQQIMYPGQDYTFPGSYVTEFPLKNMGNKRFGQKGLQNNSERFLKNWVEKRKINDPYIQEAYAMDQPELIKRAQSFPSVTTVPEIGGDPYITGRYDANTGKVFRTPDAPPHVITHEQSHYLQNFPNYMRTVHKDIVANELKPVEELTGDYKEMYPYFSSPDEVHSRIMVLREKAGFKPKKPVTEKKLDKFLKGYKGDVDNINDLLELSKDKKSLLNMLNYMAKNDQPTEYYGQAGMQKPIVLEPDYDMYKAPRQGNYLLPDINRPYYIDEAGDKRSEYRIGTNIDGKETLLPTVVGGRQLNPDEARERYYQTGLHMGMYDTPEQAEYASRLRTAKYNMLQDPARFNASIFKVGGTNKPIPTSDMAKVKAYKDSLNLYNKYPTPRNKQSFMTRSNTVPGWFDNQIQRLPYNNIKPIAFNLESVDRAGYHTPIYAEPKQPYIYNTTPSTPSSTSENKTLSGTLPPLKQWQYMNTEEKKAAIKKYGNPNTWPFPGVRVPLFEEGGVIRQSKSQVKQTLKYSKQKPNKI